MAVSQQLQVRIEALWELMMLAVAIAMENNSIPEPKSMTVLLGPT
jgi:hypothetical protein